MSFIGAGKRRYVGRFCYYFSILGTIETNVFTPYKINSGSQILFTARMRAWKCAFDNVYSKPITVQDFIISSRLVCC
jgi:hypothetical protein